MKKFCTRCGRQFESIGREVICPACKTAAQEESKKAAVLKAKRASWTGESVPVRISGRASTIIRKYGEAHDVPFAAALDELLKATPFFEKLGVEWSTIVPYKSRRRDKHATENTTETAQEVKPQGKPQDKPQTASKPQTAQAAKVASKTTSTAKKVTSKAAKASEAGEK